MAAAALSALGSIALLAAWTRLLAAEQAPPPADVAGVAVVIATHNGSGTVSETVGSVAGQADVYVVSDGSTDATAETARAAGAVVLELTENRGKPAAIYRAVRELRLTERYDAIAILDDDTVVAPDFVPRAVRALRPGVAIVVGRTITRWDAARRWNIWLGCRAYAYWRYQATIRRGQSALNALNCISGSNSLYRSTLLDQVLVESTPYIVDDTFWTLETHRRGLGRIVYAPDAHAWICDPLDFRSWYRQNLRWLWGTFQGVRGHRIGTRATVFDALYVLMILDWILYLVGPPLLIALIVWQRWFSPVRVAESYALGFFVWTAAGAAALRRWQLLLMAPAIVVIDWIYRFAFAHALVLAVRRPRVESCRWESPARYV
jgi:poly-beta-1,6-N-acetyl-D-glucosamine synthase